MRSVHGKKIIKRTYNGETMPYKKYLSFLRNDFGNICGYCGKPEEFASTGFEIDHFVPRSFNPSLVNDYSNLVYCCHTCNRKKSNKWPTQSNLKSHDEKIGLIDPVSDEYDKNITRDDNGDIIGITELGEFICNNIFKFNIRPMSIIYKLESLEEIKRELERRNTYLNEEKLKKLRDIESQLRDLKKIIFEKKE